MIVHAECTCIIWKFMGVIECTRRLSPTLTSSSSLIHYLFLRRLLPPQLHLCAMHPGRGSSSSPSSSFARASPRGREHPNMGSNGGDSRGHGRGVELGSSQSIDTLGGLLKCNLNIGSNGSDSRGRDRGHGRGVQLSSSQRIDTLGRLLVRILRHGATGLNLDMRSDGYVKLQDLLKLNMKTRSNVPLSSHSIDDVREAVRVDNKQRLGLLEEDGELWIRANQGHSVKSVETESLLEPILSAEQIPVCIHGTYKRHLESILGSGLKRMSRLHIHFACGLPSDGEVISGMRRDVNLLIFIDTKKAMEDGMKFYKSENEVLLTEGFDGAVPAKYFQKIISWPNKKLVPFQT